MSPIFSKADPKGWLKGNEQRNLLLKAALISAGGLRQHLKLCRCQFGETVVEHQFDVVFARTERPVAFLGLIPVEPVALDVFRIVFHRTVQLSPGIKPDCFAPGEFLRSDWSNPNVIIPISRGIAPTDCNFVA